MPPRSVRYEISCGLQHPIPGFPKVLGWRASDLPKLPEDYPSEFKDLLQVHSYVMLGAECDVLFEPPVVAAVGCWFGRNGSVGLIDCMAPSGWDNRFQLSACREVCACE